MSGQGIPTSGPLFPLTPVSSTGQALSLSKGLRWLRIPSGRSTDQGQGFVLSCFGACATAARKASSRNASAPSWRSGEKQPPKIFHACCIFGRFLGVTAGAIREWRFYVPGRPGAVGTCLHVGLGRGRYAGEVRIRPGGWPIGGPGCSGTGRCPGSAGRAARRLALERPGKRRLRNPCRTGQPAILRGVRCLLPWPGAGAGVHSQPTVGGRRGGHNASIGRLLP